MFSRVISLLRPRQDLRRVLPLELRTTSSTTIKLYKCASPAALSGRECEARGERSAKHLPVLLLRLVRLVVVVVCYECIMNVLAWFSPLGHPAPQGRTGAPTRHGLGTRTPSSDPQVPRVGDRLLSILGPFVIKSVSSVYYHVLSKYYPCINICIIIPCINMCIICMYQLCIIIAVSSTHS